MGPDLLASLLALNLGVVLTLALRPIWQRGFGATATYTLWLLPPLLSVSALLPQGGTQLGSVRLLAHQVTKPLLQVTDVAANTGAGLLLWCWLAGALALGTCIWIAHSRLRGRIEFATAEHCREYPELTIARADFGPALIGLWRPRLVLPYDFESRYQPMQRTLVFAHEAAHQNSGDLWVRFLALTLCVTQWWNPLTWWALLRLIDDQEAACDVRVLRSHPQSAALYAKTLIAANGPAVPGTVIFCSLHPVHPLLWRIKMLKQAASTTASSRLAGVMTLLVLTGGRIEIGERVPEGFRGVRLDATVLNWGERVNLAPTASGPNAGNAAVGRKDR